MTEFERSESMRKQSLVSVLSFLGVLGVTPTSAQPPVPPPATAVLVNLTTKQDADRTQITKTMPDEVRATVKLYLDGKIQQ